MSLTQMYVQMWDCLAAAAREEDVPFKVMQAATISLECRDGNGHSDTVLSGKLTVIRVGN